MCDQTISNFLVYNLQLLCVESPTFCVQPPTSCVQPPTSCVQPPILCITSTFMCTTSNFLCTTSNFLITAVRRHCTDWYEIWALTEHEIYYTHKNLSLISAYFQLARSRKRKKVWVRSNPAPPSDLSDEPASRLVEADLFLIPLEWCNSEPAKRETGKISFANKKRRLFVKDSRWGKSFLGLGQ